MSTSPDNDPITTIPAAWAKLERKNAEIQRLREQLLVERACRRSLAHGARGLLIDLPIKRDWCNPDNERMLHEGVKESARLDKETS